MNEGYRKHEMNEPSIREVLQQHPSGRDGVVRLYFTCCGDDRGQVHGDRSYEAPKL